MISCVSISTTYTLSHRRRTLPHSCRPPLSSPATLFGSYQSENHAFGVHNLRPITAIHSSPIPFDISPPPIDHDFLTVGALINSCHKELQAGGQDDESIAGSKVLEDWGAETLNNDDEALHAVESGTVVVDLSHYGRIRGFTFGYLGYGHTDILYMSCNKGYAGRVSGDDRLQFLHNQSTANFEVLREGEGCDTVFVTPTARTIDIAHAWVMKTAVTLVVSPLKSESISGMLTKYIFLADKVEIEDITGKTCLFVLVGPQSNQVIKNLGLGELIGKPYGSHKHYSVSGKPITVAVGNVISEEGFSLLTTPDAAGLVWKGLVSLGATPMGSNAWETFRILQGRPAPGKELTDEFNVLEAGLWNSISLNKGCYKGQETISRLVTYDGVKQRLWGIHLSSHVEPGSQITVDGKKVGKLTSYAKNGSEHFGLGYIKKRAASKGDTVIVGDNITGTVVEVPYLARQRPLSIKSKP